MRFFKNTPVSVLAAIALIVALSTSAFAGFIIANRHNVSMSTWSSSSPSLDTIPATSTYMKVAINPNVSISRPYGTQKAKFYEVTPSNTVVQLVAEIDFSAGATIPAGVDTDIPGEAVVPITPGNQIRGVVVGSGPTLPDGQVVFTYYN